jgi:hypothetical protein
VDRTLSHPLLRPGMHRCPAHADRRASLSVTQTRDGRWLVHCFSACPTEAVLRAAGLTWADLFTTRADRAGAPPPRPLTIHDRALQIAEREPWRRRGARDVRVIADALRTQRNLVDRARRAATAAGESEHAWSLLAEVARLETALNAIESAHDACLIIERDEKLA